tara:strand:+ start:1199 stop:1786 length:588 start_codon:yes stop_codon:yes gene_type:complete
MKQISPLSNVLKKGLFGDYEDKNENNLIKINERNNLLIFQIVQYKNSSLNIKGIVIDGLKINHESLNVICNNHTRILWNGPKNWLLVSNKKELKEEIIKIFNQTEFAITDLSHSRAIIEIEGENSKEVLKKGCPYNFNELNNNMCVNSVFNGITITIDMLEENSKKIRLFVLRSFGESLYESISDACLEYGYKSE